MGWLPVLWRGRVCDGEGRPCRLLSELSGPERLSGLCIC